MAFVLAKGLSLDRGYRAFRHVSLCYEQRRPHVEKPSASNLQNKLEAEKEFADWIEHFGLGKTDGSVEWRDQKLEAKVAELFRQTLEASRVRVYLLIVDTQEIGHKHPSC